jgi:diacylglycerol kinase (ATP)
MGEAGAILIHPSGEAAGDPGLSAMRKILLLVNPMLQRTRARRRDIAAVLEVFREAGAAVEVLETGENRAAGPKASKGAAEGCDAIVVCGGDGTIFDVIQGLAGSTVPLGIIPFGTGNVMAQNLKVPKGAEAAARWILHASPIPVPLGRITCCTPQGRDTWLFAMAAGMGLHAALMSEARRAGKDVTGRAAYFLAGGRLLLNHAVQPFDVTITTTSGDVIQEQACEALALRVAELNRWRTGGGLSFPFLRLATVRGDSRARLALASYEALFRSGGARDREHRQDASAIYRDVVRVVCSPIPGQAYKPAIAVQADGEVLGASCAAIEMAGRDVHLLAAD